MADAVDMRRPEFFVCRSDRLIARLTAFLTMWRFARQIGALTIVCWPERKESPKAGLPAERFDLSSLWDLVAFYRDGGHKELIFAPGSRPQGLASLSAPELSEMRSDGFDRSFFDDQDTQYFEDNPKGYCFKDEDPEDIGGQLAELFDRLPLHRSIARSVKIAKRQIAGPYVALHVRRGDVPRMLRSAVTEDGTGPLGSTSLAYLRHLTGRTAPIDFYEAPVNERLTRGEKVVLFTDEPGMAEQFHARFGADRLIIGSALGEPTLSDLQKAMVDFILLKDAREIVATSTGYSVFAARLGQSLHHSVTCAGPFDEFLSYLFDDVLAGIKHTDDRRCEIIEAVRPMYEWHAA